MLSEKQGKRLISYVSDYTVFDLETTGISSARDQVIEISAVKVRNGKVIDEFSSLVNPLMPIPYGATAVNGITDVMVKNSPTFDVVFAEFLRFVGNDILVGHNIHSFDMKFLYRDAKRFWGRTLNNDYIDTLSMARIRLPQLRNHKLTDLADFYGISSEGAHRALCDCRMNQKVFEYLGQQSPKAFISPCAEKICPVCGSEMKKRNGRYGEFWGCTSYPRCRYTENI